MIDYKATIKNIHSALSDLNIDELLIILDCIKEIPNYNNSVHINSGGYTYPSIDNVLLTSKLKSPSVSDTLYSLQLETDHTTGNLVNCINTAKKHKDNEANSSILLYNVNGDLAIKLSRLLLCLLITINYIY